MLKSLWKNNWYIKKYPDTWHGIGTFTNSIYYGLGKNELENYTPKGHYEGKHFIDCGTNEELFLALVALRDDTDRNHWFVLDEDWPHTVIYGEQEVVEIIPKYSYVRLSHSNNINECFANNPIIAHKATPAELIEHFDKNEKMQEKEV